MTDKSQVPAKTPALNTVSGFSQVLKNYEKSIAQLLQTKYGISKEEFFVICVNAVKKNPKLLQCNPRSLFGAILLCAEVGLRPNTPEQHVFIIPRGKEACFQFGYKGIIALMYRNPRVLSIFAEAVFLKDEFDYEYGLNPRLDHKPYRGSDKGKIVATYCVCKLKDTDPIFTVVEQSELQAIADMSPNTTEYSARKNGKDVHHYMDIKAAVKKISKLIQSDSNNELSRAVEYDGRLEGGATIEAPLLDSMDEIALPTVLNISDSLQHVFDGEIQLEESIEQMDVSDEILEKQITATEKEIKEPPAKTIEKETHEKNPEEHVIDKKKDEELKSGEQAALFDIPKEEPASKEPPPYTPTDEDKSLFPETSTDEDEEVNENNDLF